MQLDQKTVNTILELMQPLMKTADERQMRVELAFMGSGKKPPAIDYEGATQSACFRILKTLIDYGEIEVGKQALWVLLESLINEYGVTKQNQIRALESLLNTPNSTLLQASPTDKGKPSQSGQSWWGSLTEGQGVIIGALIAGIFTVFAAWIALGRDKIPENPIPEATTMAQVVTDGSIPTGLPIISIEPTATGFPTNSPEPRATFTDVPTLTATVTNTPIPHPTDPMPPSPTNFPEPSIVSTISSDSFVPQISVDPFTGHTTTYVPEGIFSDENGSTTAAFKIDVYEVTTTLFVEFINTRGVGSQSEPYFDRNAVNSGISLTSRFQVQTGSEEHPVTEVTWFGAAAYCQWVGGRLPTATEWHKAATWNPATGTSTTYPWGDQFEPLLTNIGGNSGIQTVNSLESGRSPVGAYHMLGNVWEWVADTQGANRFYLGSAYDTDIRIVSPRVRQRSSGSNHVPNVGFRCAFDT